MSNLVEWGSFFHVAIAGLLIGAGIPAIFALGLRLVAKPAAGAPAGATPGELLRAAPVRFAAGVACFAVVLAVVVLGLVYLVALR